MFKYKLFLLVGIELFIKVISVWYYMIVLNEFLICMIVLKL